MNGFNYIYVMRHLLIVLVLLCFSCGNKSKSETINNQNIDLSLNEEIQLLESDSLSLPYVSFY